MEYNKEEFRKLYEFVKKEKVHNIITNDEKLNNTKLKFKLLNEDFHVCLYIVAIDSQDSKSINCLNNNFYNLIESNESKGKVNDAYNIIYKRGLLDKKRLQILISMSLINDIQFKISSDLLQSIIDNRDTVFLKEILKLNNYNNTFIISILDTSKFKNHPKSNIQFENILHKERNKNGLNEEQKHNILIQALENKYEDLVSIIISNDLKIDRKSVV